MNMLYGGNCTFGFVVNIYSLELLVNIYLVKVKYNILVPEIGSNYMTSSG